jgi:hypothetical protein
MWKLENGDIRSIVRLLQNRVDRLEQFLQFLESLILSKGKRKIYEIWPEQMVPTWHSTSTAAQIP